MQIERVSHIHPGRVLLEDFLAPKGISLWRLAKDIGVPARHIYEIVQGQRAINADIAHRLAHYFGMSERYWLDLQARFDGKQPFVLDFTKGYATSFLFPLFLIVARSERRSCRKSFLRNNRYATPDDEIIVRRISP